MHQCGCDASTLHLQMTPAMLPKLAQLLKDSSWRALPSIDSGSMRVGNTEQPLQVRGYAQHVELCMVWCSMCSVLLCCECCLRAGGGHSQVSRFRLFFGTEY